MSVSGCEEMYRSSTCNRRQMLRAGGLGLLSAGVAGISPLSVKGTTLPNGFGRAKRCIFLFMWGGPSQLETFDMKPHAPAEVRGEFNPISTATPGLQICEHFRNVSQVTNKVAVIRSLSHTDSAHLSSGHATLTGHLAPAINSDRDPPSDRDTPHLGAMMARLRSSRNDMPRSVILPWKAYHPAAPGGAAPGQHGGWLGAKYNPMVLTGDPNDADWRVPSLCLPDGLSVDRLSNRRDVLRQLNRQRHALEQTAASAQWNEYQHGVAGFLTSSRVAEAFDLSRESNETRDWYGRNIHGQCVLLARRLVEYGVPVVNVNWHDDGQNFWDTHGNNFNRLKNDLIPPADRALAALLEDLEQRGLLEETIVAWVGEFGRRPTITANNAGREHWPHCYNGLLAGGGIQGGAVHGTSDKHAAYPATHPVSPQDYAATIFHALGVDTGQVLADREGRPHAVCRGNAILPLLT